MLTRFFTLKYINKYLFIKNVYIYLKPLILIGLSQDYDSRQDPLQ